MIYIRTAILIFVLSLLTAGCSKPELPRNNIQPDSHAIKDLIPPERYLAPTETRTFIESVPGDSLKVRLVAKGAGYKSEMVIAFDNNIYVFTSQDDSKEVTPFNHLETQDGKIMLHSGTFLLQDWFAGAEHIFLGEVRLGPYRFRSDTTYPLTFQVVKDSGYMYICGRGTVQHDNQPAVHLGESQAPGDWLDRLTNGNTLEKQGAASALGWYKDKAAVPALTAATKDTSWKVRRNAAEALGRIGDQTGAAALAIVADDTVKWVVAVALEALGRLGEAGLPELKKRLRSGEEKTRLAAIYGLGASAQEEAVVILASLLHPDTVIGSTGREAALESLGRIGKPSCVAPLIAAIHSHDISSVRCAAVRALGQIGTPDVAEGLNVASRDSVPDVRKTTAWTLGRIQDSYAMAILEKLSHDLNSDVSEAAKESIKNRSMKR